MSDQITTSAHICNDVIARERTEALRRQRIEDRQEVSKALETTSEMLGKLDKKLDTVVATQAQHGTQIAVLCEKDSAQKIPPWLKAVIGAVVAAILAAGGYGVNEATQAPKPAPTEAAR